MPMTMAEYEQTFDALDRLAFIARKTMKRIGSLDDKLDACRMERNMVEALRMMRISRFQAERVLEYFELYVADEEKENI